MRTNWATEEKSPKGLQEWKNALPLFPCTRYVCVCAGAVYLCWFKKSKSRDQHKLAHGSRTRCAGVRARRGMGKPTPRNARRLQRKRNKMKVPEPCGRRRDLGRDLSSPAPRRQAPSKFSGKNQNEGKTSGTDKSPERERLLFGLAPDPTPLTIEHYSYLHFGFLTAGECSEGLSPGEECR